MAAGLVVLSGPIGAGKSTVAELIGRWIEGAGCTVAIVDLDDIAFMQRGRIELRDFWQRAGAAHCALVRSWYAQGVDVVVAHGPFFESATYQELFDSAPPGGRLLHVVLTVTYEEALARVTSDSDRRSDAISRDPEFLRQTHDAFREVQKRLPDVDVQLDTTGRSAAEIADLIAPVVLGL